MMKRLFLTSLTLASLLTVSSAQTIVRVGAFPNITHAQAMVGKANGWFDKAMGTRVKVITAEILYLSLEPGQVLMMGRDLNDMSAVIAVMILITEIGYVVDRLVFKTMEGRLQKRWGLTSST